MNLSGRLLKMAGWTVEITVPDYPKCVICVAPHTSNWDFVLGKLAYASINRKAGFMMKSSWFFFPMGLLFKAIGGVPVYRGKGTGLVDQMVERFKTTPRLTIAITPEGTRSRTSKWHTGFLRIARDANVPLLLGILDYAHKRIVISDEYIPTGDMEHDINAVKDFYAPYSGKYPDKFSTEH